ncbi:MAG: hypothetical protein JOZ02_04780 [Acidobacteria bacterium]|nr:hypothetical protein [Acidobacteriota bacterium]
MKQGGAVTILPGRLAALTLLSLALLCAALARQGGANRQAKNELPRTLYRINFDLDFDARTYTGRERVRWVNLDDRPASVVYFHLYPNLRAEDERAGAQADAAAPEEPRLLVTAVRAGEGGQLLPFTADDADAVTLRVQLREAVAPGTAAEIELAFKGTVPEIDPDETSLTAHVVQQVGAAMRDTREIRRARDTNFVSRGVMMLAGFHPVLAAREGDDWQRKVEPSVGETFFTDVADYEVEVETAEGVNLFASCGQGPEPGPGHKPQFAFAGEDLRGFALVAGRTLRAEEREAGGVRVRSVYTPEHEKVGRRVLNVAADAARTFAARFGPLPLKSVTVTEAPLVAGFGSAEFSGLAVIAGAFYVDFDSPAMRALPELVREQRASVEDNLEFAAAQGVARQWWGGAVGSDPAREPVLHEALSQFSALLYVQDVRGAESAQQVQDDQLRGVYQVYRTFGGEDVTADRPAREYRNSFQYAAVVAGKGALMFVELRRLLGEERFFKALRGYYEANRLEVAETEDLRAAFAAVAELPQRRALTRTFNRWLSERHGDEDIAPPNPQLLAALGFTPEQQQAARDRNAFSRLGRFFWRQMTRIR